MNKSPKVYHRVVGVRLTETDTINLDRICAALEVTRSEFVRRKIENINNTFIKNKDIFNISEGPATDAWGRKTETLQHQKEENEKEVMNQVEAMMNPPTTIYNVKGIYGHFKSGFNLYIQSATKDKAVEYAKKIRFVPGSSVKITSATTVTAASAKGKKIFKA